MPTMPKTLVTMYFMTPKVGGPLLLNKNTNLFTVTSPNDPNAYYATTQSLANTYRTANGLTSTASVTAIPLFIQQ